MKIIVSFLFFFLVNFIKSDGDFDVECATLIDEYGHFIFY